MAVSRIAEASVPVVVTLGNSGNQGLWEAASPAAGLEVTAVRSAENTLSPVIETAGTFSTGDEAPEYFGIRWGSPVFQENLTLPLWSVSDAIGAVACTALPDDTSDLSGYAFLIGMSVSGCIPEDQAGNIAAKGGQYIIYYSLTNG
jgi:hypothetical protein